MITIRRIEPRDDAAVEAIIRSCLIEYGANHAGCAWEDDLSHFSALYAAPGTAYWVADNDGTVVACGGIGGPAVHPQMGRVCELQKMYCLPAYRGTGIAQRLMEEAVGFAAPLYDCIYIETFSNMTRAGSFYRRNGFRRTDLMLIETGHSTIDVRMLLEPLFFLKTARLGFARWKPGDSDRARRLWGDPQVTRYICASGWFSEADIEARLRRELECQQENGIQYWPLYHLESGDLVGCCGLHPHGETHELGFHLRPEYWRQGYASEAAGAVIDYAFNTLGMDTLFAGHNPKNTASGQVLKKLGFEYTGDEYYAPTGLYHPSYSLTH